MPRDVEQVAAQRVVYSRLKNRRRFRPCEPEGVTASRTTAGDEFSAVEPMLLPARADFAEIALDMVVPQ